MPYLAELGVGPCLGNGCRPLVYANSLFANQIK